MNPSPLIGPVEKKKQKERQIKRLVGKGEGAWSGGKVKAVCSKLGMNYK